MRPIVFETSDGSKTPVITALPSRGTTSATIIRTLKKGSAKVIPKTDAKPKSPIDSDGPKSTIFIPDKRNSWIQPPPEVHLQAPYKDPRLRKETPSLMTQATGTSTNSYSPVITYARKNPFVSATAKTLMMNTMSSKNTPSPREKVFSHGARPGIDSGPKVSINMAPQRMPTLVRATNGTQGVTQFVAPASWETVGEAGQDLPSGVNFSPRLDSGGRI